MKTILFAVLTIASAVSFAQMDITPNLQYPTDWNVGMLSMACNIDAADLKGATVSVEKAGKARLYTAKKNGKVVAQAWTSNTTVFAEKQCLQLK